MSKPQVSVVMATYNEADNIGRSLNSVLDIAGEIIVVDGSSTDDTAAIARSLGAKVTVVDNRLNFHVNKQLAMDKASGWLVLQLDADEVVDPELAAFINRTAQQRPAAADAWWIRRKNLYLGRWLTKGGQYPDPVIRLYRRGRARLPQVSVHEQMEVSGEVGWADGHILHHTSPEFGITIRKLNTYTSFMARQLDEKGISINPTSVLTAFVIKPIATFTSLYVRHRGYVDGLAGLVFALMSAVHHPIAFLKLWELRQPVTGQGVAATTKQTGPTPGAMASSTASSTLNATEPD